VGVIIALGPKEEEEEKRLYRERPFEGDVERRRARQRLRSN